MKEFAGGAPFIQHEDRILKQLFQIQFHAFEFGERLIGEEDIPEFPDLSDTGNISQVRIGVVDYDQIHLAAFQQFHAADGGGIGDLDMGAGKFLVESFQIGYQEVPADGVARPDPYLSAFGIGFHQLRLSPLDQVHRRLHMAQQNLPFRGQAYPFGAADEQSLVQFLLQSLDGLADR